MAVARAPSLRARAIKLLAMREQSRSELLRKLAPHAESPEQVHALLDSLEQAGHLSEERFAQSLARRRAERYGRRFIAQELDQHRVAADVAAPILADLAVDERSRAQAVWARRFTQAPADLAERARQHRFLAQRGFDGETIAWVLRHAAAQERDA